MRKEFVVIRELSPQEKQELDKLEADYKAAKAILEKCDQRRDLIYNNIFNKEDFEVGTYVKIKGKFIYRQEVLNG